MNEPELTAEMIDDACKCEDILCENCNIYKNGICIRETCLEFLAKALKSEKAKPKVWDSAPKWATMSTINFSDITGIDIIQKIYTRELPKTETRLIAEKWAYSASIDPDVVRIEKTNLSDLIEKAILEAKGDI